MVKEAAAEGATFPWYSPVKTGLTRQNQRPSPKPE
jgi:hypothetical protein